MSSEPVSGTRVVVAGFYGVANLGDEMILAAFLAWIREAGGVPIVISVNPHYTRRAHGVDAVGYYDLPAIVETLADADLLLLGGGGLFQDHDAFDRRSLARFPAANVSQFAQFFMLAEELGVATAALAQGVGPLRSDDARAITADVFRRAGTASVRDEASAALLRTLGVERKVVVAPDPAWTLRVAAIAPAERFAALAGGPVLALVVRDWPFDRAWEEALVAGLDAAMPRAWGLLWIDFARVPDAALERPQAHEIAPRLAARLPGLRHAIWDGLWPDEAAGLIAGSDALVAMRLHGVLVGHLAARPVVAIEYDAKVRALGDALDVPVMQRMSLDEVATRLPGALGILCGSDRAFRVDAATTARLVDEALAHRALLGQAMAHVRVHASPAPAQDRENMLAGWMADQDDAGRKRIAEAVAARRRRNGG